MPTPFDCYVEKPARVSSTCLVSVALNRYSVPCVLHWQMVGTRLYPGRVVVVASDEVVARHDRLSSASETRYDWQHYIPLQQREPGALRNGAPFADMPELLQRLRRGLLRSPGGDRVMALVLAIVITAGLDAVLVAVETGPPGKVSVEHAVNVLGPLNAELAPQAAATSLQVRRRRWPTRGATTACAPTALTTSPRRPAMTRDVTVELKQLRLHGMAGAWGGARNERGAGLRALVGSKVVMLHSSKGQMSQSWPPRVWRHGHVDTCCDDHNDDARACFCPLCAGRGCRLCAPAGSDLRH